MARFPSLLSVAAALTAILSMSPHACACGWGTPPVSDGSSGGDECAETGIPWIAVAPESCNTAAGAVATKEAGIHPLAAGGLPVYVDVNGELGTVTSSARYKMDITNMDFDAARLLELRPVTFHYKANPGGPVQFGLIAEEVEKLFPDLVVHDADGKVQSVRYDELSSILLKEVQAQETAMARQQDAMGEQQKQMDAQAEKMERQYHQMQAQDEQIRYLGDRVAHMQKLVEKLTKASQ
jgi:hypothetical protein